MHHFRSQILNVWEANHVCLSWMSVVAGGGIDISGNGIVNITFADWQTDFVDITSIA